MAKYTTTLTAQNTYAYLCTIKKKRDLVNWEGYMLAYGTFGGGTVTWYLSPDGGTTKIAWKDISGNSYTSTADDNFATMWGRGSTNNDMPQVYVGIGAATSPSITIACYDNN